MAIIQVIDGNGTKTASNANSVYHFLKSLEPLSIRQPVNIMHSSIRIDQKLVKTLSGKSPSYAAATLSQSYKMKAPVSKIAFTKRVDLNKTLNQFKDDASKTPEFCSVFKPASSSENEALSNGSDWRASINKIFLREPRSATCECSSNYVTAEFSQRFNPEHNLTQDFNNTLLAALKLGSVSKEEFKLIRLTLIKNERRIEDLEKECSNNKQLMQSLQSTLVRIQSLCNLYY